MKEMHSLFDQKFTKINYLDFCSWFNCPAELAAINDANHWTYTVFPEMRKFVSGQNGSFDDFFPKAQFIGGKTMISKSAFINTLVKTYKLNINVAEIQDLLDLLGVNGPT